MLATVVAAARSAGAGAGSAGVAPTFSNAAASGADVGSASSATVAIRLQGILYQPAHPSAIVNDQLLTLDKTVTLNTGGGTITVRALEITRDRVVLESAGQKVELHLNSQSSTRQP